MDFRRLTVSLAVAGVLGWRGAPAAQAADSGPIKVGVLHSLSGTMAILSLIHI